MAVVDDHLARALTRAASDGRIRDEALRLFTHARAEPQRAGSILAKGLRALRGLHSRDRRGLGDRLYWWIRHERWLQHALGTQDPLANWLGVLVHEGLPSNVAAKLWRAKKQGNLPDFSNTQALPEPVSFEIRASMDPSIAALLHDDLGDEAEAFVHASNQRAPMMLRVNTHAMDRDRLAQRLAEEGVKTRPGQWSHEALEVIGRCNAPALQSYRNGWFEVQDEGSQLLSQLVTACGPILDLCAGAGGKSLALASRGIGPIVATDIRERALSELTKRARRSRLTIRTQHIQRHGLPDNLNARRFSSVLVDAPCSGFGVLRRHPEHRWLLNNDTLSKLLKTQDELLDRAASVTKPGGQVVYGTCSVLRCENIDRVEAFLLRHPGWRVLEAPTPVNTRAGAYLALTPHRHGTDGFFGAILQAPSTT